MQEGHMCLEAKGGFSTALLFCCFFCAAMPVRIACGHTCCPEDSDHPSQGKLVGAAEEGNQVRLMEIYGIERKRVKMQL